VSDGAQGLARRIDDDAVGVEAAGTLVIVDPGDERALRDRSDRRPFGLALGAHARAREGGDLAGAGHLLRELRLLREDGGDLRRGGAADVGRLLELLLSAGVVAEREEALALGDRRPPLRLVLGQ